MADKMECRFVGNEYFIVFKEGAPNAAEDFLLSYERMKQALERIRDYKPKEICKDEFAYDRIVQAYREAAIYGLEGVK